MSEDHKPIDADRIPLAHESEAIIAEHAPAALRVLTGLGALDLAPVLGLEVAS